MCLVFANIKFTIYGVSGFIDCIIHISIYQAEPDEILLLYPAINFGGTGWIRTNSVSMCRIYSPMPIRRLSSRPNIVIIACCDYLSRRKFGAGEGNRTLVGALATLCFTIKLLPHYLYISFVGTLPKIRTWN